MALCEVFAAARAGLEILRCSGHEGLLSAYTLGRRELATKTRRYMR